MLIKNYKSALGGVAQLKRWPGHQKVANSIPSQVIYPGYQFNPWFRLVQEAADLSLTLAITISPSL